MTGLLLDRLRGKRRICLDTAVLIYFVEENSHYLPIVEPLFSHIEEAQLPTVSSYLTLLEVLIQPLRARNHIVADEYRDILLRNQLLQLLAVDQHVAEQAAAIRAHYNFRIADSIQLATGVLAQADLFITNDRQLKQFTRLDVLVLEDYCIA